MKNLNRKKLILISLLIIAFIISAIIIFNKATVSRNLVSAAPELMRARTYGELSEDDEKTDSEFVRFSAFFLRDLDQDGYAEKVKGTCKQTGESDTLYMSLNVLTEGLFTNGKIEIQGNNIYFQTALVDDEVINGTYISNNTTEINLKDVQVGTQKLIFGEARSGAYDGSASRIAAIGNDTSKYSATNKIILTGTHVANDGTETEIRKEVELPVDWYNTPKAEISYKYAGGENNLYQNYDLSEIINEEAQRIDISFKIVPQETKNLQNLSKSYIVGEIPRFNGYDPLMVEIKGTRVTYTYDTETRMFTAERNARTSLDGKILTEAYSGVYSNTRYNEYTVNVSYPLEAYETLGIDTINLAIPVKAWYEGFNNPNEEFSNPVKSNIAEEIINVVFEYGGGDVISIEASVGDFVESPYNAMVISKNIPETIYKGENNSNYSDYSQEYPVTWYVVRGDDGVISNVRLREQSDNYTDKFLTTDNQYIDMIDFTSNISIGFSGAGNMLGPDGYIDVINDETNELIHRFTSEDWDYYTESNQYYYETPIKHIRVETSATSQLSRLYIYHTKLLDNEAITNTFTQEEFEKFRLVYTYLNGSVKYSEDDAYTEIKNDIERANYDSIKSVATISINPEIYSTQEIQENVQVVINAQRLSYNTTSWMNGEFLVKFPKEILELNINDISISTSSVEILGHSLEEKEDGHYLKIITENKYTSNYTYRITIDCDITPDPRTLSETKDIELYAINQVASSYLSETADIYDIDNDGNTDEFVGKSTKAVTFVGPTSIITMEKATEYNETNDSLQTAVSPQIAIIDKTQADKTAKISATLINNYSGNVSEIKVVGKIPFEGNTYQINDNDMGSMFTSKIIEPITLSEELQPYATIYYSENEVVTKDIEDTNNNWILAENVTDFTNIKSYLVDFGAYVMQKGEEQNCTYKIQIPDDVEYNDVAYSTHAVYFALKTSEGKLRDETETNKLGFMIARKYTLEINKVKKGSDTRIQGASFSVTEVGNENAKILSTDSEGKILLTDLYVERDYIIKEVKAPYDYIRNDEEVKIRGTVVESELIVNELTEEIVETENAEDGTITSETIVVETPLSIIDGEYGKTAVVTVENEPKYTLRLTKYEKGTDTVIQGIQFSLYGKGMPNGGKYIKTNKDGQFIITGLYPGQTYWLYEEYAEGYTYDYYSMAFIANWNENGELEVQVTSGAFRDEPTIDSTPEHQPIMDVAVENTKLREYSLSLTKFEKDTNITLAGARFYISGSWLNETITTDENGELYLPTLYEGQYYYIYEQLPPNGYVLSTNRVRFYGEFSETGELQIHVTSGELAPNVNNEWTEQGTIFNSSGEQITGKKVAVTQDGNGKYQFNLGFENETLFKLTKLDGTTYEPLEGAKFAIYSLSNTNTEGLASTVKGYRVGQFEESSVEVTFKEAEKAIAAGDTGEESDEPVYHWYKNIEDIWCSGNAGIDSSSSTLTSDEFTLAESQFITFQQAVSSEYSDYAYYKIVDAETNTTISESSMSGYYYYEYAELYYITRNIHLKPGTYKIIFTYSKNAENSNGYDASYIKNIKLGNYVTSTDELGRIALDLPQGTYKIIEIEAPEGYVLDENEENRTYYMSIGQTRPEQRSVEKDEELTIETAGNITYTQELATSDGGTIVGGSVSGNITIPAEETVSGEEIYLNSGNDGIIIKYNSDNKIEWAKRTYGSAAVTPRKFVEVDDGYVALVDAQTLTIPAEQTIGGEQIKLTARNTDGMVLKYSFDGLVEWGVCTYGWCADYIRDIVFTDDGGFITVGYWTGGSDFSFSDQKTSSGEWMQLLNSEGKSSASSIIAKYNSDHLVEWARSISGTGNNYINSIHEITNEAGETEYLCVADIGGATLLDEQIAEGTDVTYESGAYRGLLKFNIEGQINKFYDSFSTAPVYHLKEDNSVVLVQKNIAVEYDSTGEIVKNVSLSNLPFTFSDIVSCEDGGYIAVGTHNGNYTIPASITVNGESIACTTAGKNDFVMVKFTEDFIIEDARMFGSSADDSNIRIEKLTNGQYNVTLNYVGTYLEGDILLTGATLYRMDDINTVSTINSISQATSFFFDAIQTSDGGKLGVGYFKGRQTLNVNGQDAVIVANGGYDAFLLKYDENNSIEWYITLGGGEEDKFTGVAEVDGNYRVAGRYYGIQEIAAEFTETGIAIPLENKAATTYNAVILEINPEGKVLDCLNLNSSGNITLDGLKTATGTEYFAYGILANSITLENIDGEEETISSTGADDAIVYKFNSDNKLITYAVVASGQSKAESFTSMTTTLDEGVALTGTINSEVTLTTKYGETVTLTNSWQDMIVVKYDHELNLEWAHHPGPQVSYQGTRYCSTTEDGGLIVTGDLYYGSVNIPAEDTVDGKAIYFGRRNDAWCGFVIKYAEDGLVDWAIRICGAGNMYNLRPLGYENGAILLFSANNGIYIEGNYMQNGSYYSETNWSSPTYVLKCNGDGLIEYVKSIQGLPVRGGVVLEENRYLSYGGSSKNGVTTASIMTIDEYMAFAEVPAQQAIEIENTKMEFEITTDIVEDENGIKGGTVSGEDLLPYEVVKYGENAQNEIVITPDEDYKILSIKINNEEMQFIPNEQGIVVLTFDDVRENKNILVEFSTTVSDIIVHHYKDGTEEKVVEDEIFHGKVDDYYTTAPKMDLENYEIIIEKIPSNASGVYTEETQEIIYYYYAKNATLTVKHYLYGTTEEISAEGYTQEMPKGENYTTTSATDLEEKYELVTEPANKEGIIIEDTTVNYYYKIKSYNITTRVEGSGGTISGSDVLTYEEVEYGNDSQKDIIATPDEKYHVSKITVNGEEIEFETNEDGTVLLNKFIDVKEDKNVVVTFEEIPGQVIVHHYIEGTTEKVPSNVEGQVVEDEIKEGLIGTAFATKPSENVAPYYQYSSCSTQDTSGKYAEEVQEITYYYTILDFEYRIEYYYDNIIDDSKTESAIDTYGTIIDSYTDKPIEGYMVDNVENLPLKVTEIEENNVIKVYYAKEKVNYTVEYYYDGIIDSEKTEVIEAEYLTEITTYEDKNITGYKLDRVDNLPLSVTQDEKANIIKVYYVIDETQTKEISYTVEYYKDSAKVEEDTQTIIETVHVLDDETLIVNKENINTVDKYTGYAFYKTEPETIPDTVNNGDVIKIYYAKELVEYTVEYYYDGVLDETKTETKKAGHTEIVSTYKDKVIEGYKLDKTEHYPLIVDKNKENIIKVYYVIDETQTKELIYVVDYYKDGIKSEEDREIIITEVHILEPDTITVNTEDINTTDKFIGYKFEKTEPDPIPEVVNDGDLINVYYVKDSVQYTIEYYYSGVLDETKTKTLEGGYKEVIEEYPPEDVEGFEVVKTENLPLTLEREIENNVIRVYYEPKAEERELSYTVEYYKDGIIVEEDTQIITETTTEKDVDTIAVKEDLINITDKYVGYEFDKSEPEEIPDEVNSGDVIKIYYKKIQCAYTVNYYYDGVLNEEKTEQFDAFYGDEITEYPDKTEDGYELEKVETLPLIVTDNTVENIINVYYVRKDAKVIINHIDKNTDEVLETEEETGKVGDEYTSSSKEFEGYRLVEKPEQETVTMTEEVIALNYYYVKESVGVLEKHIDIKSKEVLYEKRYTGYEGDSYTTEKQEFAGYDTVTNREFYEEYIKTHPEILEEYEVTILEELLLKLELDPNAEYVPSNKEGTMTREEIVVEYYYIREIKVVVKYLDKETNEEISEQEIIEGHEGDSYTTDSKEVENYELVQEPENKDGTMLPAKAEDGSVITVVEVVYYYEKEEGPEPPEDEPDEPETPDEPVTPDDPEQPQEPDNEEPKEPDEDEPQPEEPKEESAEEPKEDKPKEPENKPQNPVITIKPNNPSKDENTADKIFPNAGNILAVIILDTTILITVITLLRLTILKNAIKNMEEDAKKKNVVVKPNGEILYKNPHNAEMKASKNTAWKENKSKK